MANATIRIESEDGKTRLLVASVADSPTLAFAVARIAEAANSLGYLGAVKRAEAEQIKFELIRDYNPAQPVDYGVRAFRGAAKAGRYYDRQLAALTPGDFRKRCSEWNALD